MSTNVSGLFKKITTFIFDMDGVLTDGSVLILENGLQARKMCIKDGYALQLAVAKGYRIIVVSGAQSATAADRLNKLGITDVFMTVLDKKSFVVKFMDDHKLRADEILFMGDDIPDQDAMSLVGLSACPADAVAEIKTMSHYISPIAGGGGCVRDVIEQVLKLKGHWHHQIDVASK